MMKLILTATAFTIGISAFQPGAYACGPQKKAKGGEQAELILPAPMTKKSAQKKPADEKRSLSLTKTVPAANQ